MSDPANRSVQPTTGAHELEPVRVAVIGTGSMGRNHARVLRQMSEAALVAIVDADQRVAEEVAELTGARAFTDIRRMLDVLQPQAVTIAAPTRLHHGLVIDALKRGCHVLVEKPIAATLAEAHEMIQVAAKTDRLLAVGHVERFNPAITELKRRIEAGEIGRIFEIACTRVGPFPARVRDVGVVLDLASHDIDVMRHLISQEVTRLFAEIRRTIHTTQEDLMCGVLRFSDETIGLLHVNWVTPTKVRQITVTGERGMFLADYLTQDLFLYENADTHAVEWQTLDVLRGVREGKMTRFVVEKTEPLRAELTSFVRAARGEPAPFVSGTDGAKALAVALELVSSATQGAVTILR